MTSTASKNRRLATLSMLSGLVAVLTVLQNIVRFGPFPITLALTPIIVGAAIYDAKAGAILGSVFGIVTFITGMFGMDGGGVLLMWSANPIALIIVCIGKATLAGFCAGLAYKLLARKKVEYGVLAAGVICPIVNTGIFLVGMITCFMGLLKEWAGGTNILSYMLVGLAGWNFVVELLVNLVLSSAITTIVKQRIGK